MKTEDSPFTADPRSGRSCFNRHNRKFVTAFLLAAFVTISTGSQAIAKVPTDGLIGWWIGNNTATDVSSVGNNGTFSGSYVPGGPGGGAAFDLSTAKVHILDNPAYDFPSYLGWTVGFWFNTNGIPIVSNNGTSNRTFLGQDNGAGFQPKWLIDYGSTVFGPNNDIILHFNDSNQERIFIESAPITLPTGWNQLTVVVNNSSSSVNFYLNGQLVSENGLPNYVLQPTADLVFGAAEPGLSYSGLMNNVTIYNRALSASEVLELQDVPEPSYGLFLIISAGLLVRIRRLGRRNLTS